MRGFLNDSLNKIIQEDAFSQISKYIVAACDEVIKSRILMGQHIPNDENIIRNVLLNDFLDEDEFREAHGMLDFRFEPECQENYKDASYAYGGRTDIKVTLQPDSFKKREAYYIIECKRLDGSMDLNKKYIDNGVNRFTAKKYSSYYGKNFMIGFIVMKIDIKKNVSEIETYQNKSADESMHGKFEFIFEKDKIMGEYKCRYCYTNEQIELSHIFFNFANIIK